MTAGDEESTGRIGWSPRTKTVAPAVRGLRRPRIEASFAGMRDGGLWVVQAPAGAGKTTAVGHAVATTGIPVAWVHCDESDDAIALRRSLMRATGTARQDDPEPLRLLEDLVDRGPLAAVYDDVHAVNDPAALADFQRLVDYRPPGVSVVLVGRFVPLDLTRAMLRDAVVIDGSDLRFRLWEVDELFRTVHGTSLGWRDLSQLERTTGGWAAGLQMFHLATRSLSPAERERLLHDLGGRSRVRREYLVRQVVGLLESEMREFVLSASVFDDMSGARCDQLLERKGSIAILDELVARGLFIEVDDGGRTYRFHEVLRSHLRETFMDQFGADAAVELSRKAAAILASEGDLVGSLKVLGRAGDWDAVASTVASAGRELPAGSGEWIDLLPDAVLGDPWVEMALARRHVRYGRPGAATAAYGRAAASLGDTHAAAACRRELSLVEKFLSPDRANPMEWTEVVSVAAGGDEPPPATRSQEPPALALGRAASMLLRGEARQAAERCGELLAAGRLPRSTGTLAAVVRSLARVLTGSPDAAAALDDAEAACTAEDQIALARIVLAARNVLPSGTTVADDALLEACALDLDEYGAAVVELLLGLGRLVRGASTAGLLDAAETDCRRLGLDGLAVLCRALLLVERAGASDAEVGREAMSMLGDARRAGPLHHAAVLAVLARSGDGRAAARAHAVAETAGLTRLVADLVDRQSDTTRSGPPSGEVEPSGRLEIELLGEFRLRLDGAVVDVDQLRPRHREVLWFLAARAPRWVHRDEIIEAMWPYSPADKVMHRLQTAVSAIRRILEPEVSRGEWSVLVRDGVRYRVTVDEPSIDLRRVESALVSAQETARRGEGDQALEPLRRILRDLRGGILSDAGSLDWLVDLRRHVEAQVGDVAVLVSERLDGDPVTRAAVAEAALALDPWNDKLWRIAIAAHEDAGNPAAASQLRLRYESQLSG